MKAKTWTRARILLSLGSMIVVSMTLVAIGAPFLLQEDPNEMSLPRQFERPSWAHPLGRDENGSDVMAKIVYGARVSLAVAFSVISISVFIGLVVGSVAGYFGRWTEQFIMRFVDMVYAFPSFLLALTLVAILGPSLRNLILALCLTSWTGFARLVRGELLHLKSRDFVQAARATGASHWRILVLHIWPNLLGLVVVQATFAMSGTIISEAGLSFLGLGVPASTPTWGAVLNSGRRVLTDAPHISISAGVAILVLVTGFNLLGDGLREILDPRRGRDRV